MTSIAINRPGNEVIVPFRLFSVELEFVSGGVGICHGRVGICHGRVGIQISNNIRHGQ